MKFVKLVKAGTITDFGNFAIDLQDYRDNTDFGISDKEILTLVKKQRPDLQIEKFEIDQIYLEGQIEWTLSAEVYSYGVDINPLIRDIGKITLNVELVYLNEDEDHYEGESAGTIKIPFNAKVNIEGYDSTNTFYIKNISVYNNEIDLNF